MWLFWCMDEHEERVGSGSVVVVVGEEGVEVAGAVFLELGVEEGGALGVDELQVNVAVLVIDVFRYGLDRLRIGIFRRCGKWR